MAVTQRNGPVQVEEWMRKAGLDPDAVMSESRADELVESAETARNNKELDKARDLLQQAMAIRRRLHGDTPHA